MKIAIYLRKSRADEEAEKQGEHETLSRHRSTLLKIAKDKKLNIVEIKEEVVSGESVGNRPKMLELLDEVEQGLYDAVLVMDIDRLGRGNMQDQGLILETFKQSNTKIITPRKIYDLNNEFDEEYSEFEAFMARKELKLITRRMQRGRVRSIEDGKYIAQSAPFGYKFEYPGPKERVLVIDNEKAEIIKIIFDMYSDGIGACRICGHLNSLGYTTTTGRTWYEKGVRDIIKNKIYCGYVVWNKVERKRNSSKKTPDKEIEAKGIHEPIISEELWNKCQNIRSTRSVSPTPNNIRSNPLAGIVKCSICGYTLTVKNATTKLKGGAQTYTKYINCTNCSNRATKLFIIEEKILESLNTWLQDYKVMLSNSDIKDDSTNIDTYTKVIENLRKELNELDKQKNKLHDLLERGIYDIDTFVERSKNLSNRINDINSTLNSTSNIIKNKKKKEQAKFKIIPALENVLEQYYITDDLDFKNKLLKSVLDHVAYTKDHNRRDEHDFNIVLYPKLPS